MRRPVFKPYQVNRKLMEQAAPGALFMTVFRASRPGVTMKCWTGRLRGAAAIGNRMYVQKAILHALFT